MTRIPSVGIQNALPGELEEAGDRFTESILADMGYPAPRRHRPPVRYPLLQTWAALLAAAAIACLLSLALGASLGVYAGQNTCANPAPAQGKTPAPVHKLT